LIIPYLISALMTPFFGLIVDKVDYLLFLFNYFHFKGGKERLINNPYFGCFPEHTSFTSIFNMLIDVLYCLFAIIIFR